MKTKITVLVVALIGLSSLGLVQSVSAANLNSVLLSTDPFPVQSGEDGEIRFKVTNGLESSTDNVTMKILDSYPFELKPDRQRVYKLGTIKEGESYYISSEFLVAEDAPDGKNDFKVKIMVGDDYSIVNNLPVTVQSNEIELNLANLKTTPSDLMPDTEDNQLSIEVVNNGEKTAENIVLELDLPNSFQKTSSFSERQSLGNIKPGQVKMAQFTFDISANATKGAKTIPTTLSYTASDNTAKIEKEENLDLYLSGKPQFEVVSTSSDLKVGQTGNVEINVKNVGSKKSESTRVRILDNSDLPFSFGSTNKFIGTLKPGKEGTVVFETEVEDDGIPKEYLLDFEVRGVKDTEVFVEDKVKGLQVEDSAGGQTQNLPINLISGLWVGVVVGYFIKRMF